MQNIITSEFTSEVENQITDIILHNNPLDSTKQIMQLGFDLFESQYYAAQGEVAKYKKDFKLTRAQINMDTFQTIFPKFK